MNTMNKKLEYALMALKYFDDQRLESLQDVIVSAKQIAEMTHAPYEVVARVLQILSSRGILKAEYGTQGGYRLEKNLSQITMHDLIVMIEGLTELAKCLSVDKECDLSAKCTIISPVQNLNQKVQNFYKSISIAEVLNV